jgi:Ca-activated chloride channel family protein
MRVACISVAFALPPFAATIFAETGDQVTPRVLGTLALAVLFAFIARLSYRRNEVPAFENAVTLRVGLLLLCSSIGFSQEEPLVFKVDTRLQSIAVQLTDRDGNYVQGLKASDFTLLENGKPQKVAFFGAEDQPVSLAVLIDSSFSMNVSGKLDQARRFLAPLIRGHHPEDEIFLLPFDDKVGKFETLTPEQRLQPPVIRAGGLGSGGTALYDALASVLCRMRGAQNIQQGVVVITDGADQHSRLKLEEVIELTRSSSVQVFAIGLYSQAEQEIYRERGKPVILANGREIDNPIVAFERLAKESGAESFFPSSDGDFQQALDRISAFMEVQYTLAYYPESEAGLRKIEVKVNRRGAKVSARRTVGSETAGKAARLTAGCEVSAEEHPYPWEPRMSLSSSNTKCYHEDFSDPRSGWPNRRTRETRPSEASSTTSNPLSNPLGINRPTTGDTRTTSQYVAGGYEISRSYSGRAMRNENSDVVIAAYGPVWSNFRASVLIESDWGRSARNAGFSDSAGVIFGLAVDGHYAFLLGVGREFAQDPSATAAGAGRDIIAYALVKRYWSSPALAIVPWTVIPPNSPAGRSLDPTAKAHKLSIESNRGQITLLVDGFQVERVEDSTFEEGYVGVGLLGKGRAVVQDLLVEELP